MGVYSSEKTRCLRLYAQSPKFLHRKGWAYFREDTVQVKILHQKVGSCHCQSLQQSFIEYCPCLLYLQIGVIIGANQPAYTTKPFFLTISCSLTKCITSWWACSLRQISLCKNFHSKVGVGVISDVGAISVEYGISKGRL